VRRCIGRRQGGGGARSCYRGETDRHFQGFVGSKEQDGPAPGKDVLEARLSVEELKEVKKWAIKIHSLRYQNV